MPTRTESRQAARVRPEERRGPRNAQEAKPKDVYYRPEYGWIMSDAQVKEEQRIKGEADKATQTVRDQIEGNKSAYQSSLAAGKGSIAAQYDQAIGAAKRPDLDLVPVRVVNGNTIEGTYMIPRSSVEKMNTDSFNKGDGSYTGNWSDPNTYNVDVRVTGTGGNRGQELHDTLRNALPSISDAQNQANAAYDASIANAQAEKGAAISGFEAASQKNYEGAAQAWNADLERVAGAYSNRVATGKAQYEDSKKKYNESVMGMDAGLLETPTKMVNPNAKVA